MHHKELYEMYCDYASTLRENVLHELAKPRKDTLPENQFARVWQSLPKIEKRRWLTRFEAGSKRVILSESSQYASVLSNDGSASLKVA